MFRRTAALAMATMLAVAVAVLAVAGCGSGGGSEAQVPSSTVQSAESTTSLATTTSSTTTTTTTTTEPPLREFEPLYADPNLSIEEQVEAAYLFHWEVLMDAYRTGSTDHLPLVFGEEMVEFQADEIRALVEAGQYVDGEVEHDYSVIVIDSNHASVVDGYTNRLVRVDRQTGQPVGEASNEQVGYEFQMERFEDQWLVTYAIRYRFSE